MPQRLCYTSAGYWILRRFAVSRLPDDARWFRFRSAWFVYLHRCGYSASWFLVSAGLFSFLLVHCRRFLRFGSCMVRWFLTPRFRLLVYTIPVSRLPYTHACSSLRFSATLGSFAHRSTTLVYTTTTLSTVCRFCLPACLLRTHALRTVLTMRFLYLLTLLPFIRGFNAALRRGPSANDGSPFTGLYSSLVSLLHQHTILFTVHLFI